MVFIFLNLSSTYYQYLKLPKRLNVQQPLLFLICVFQDLFTEKVKEIGKEEDDLYLLSQAKYNLLNNSMDASANEARCGKIKCDVGLQHKRCDHVSIIILKKLFSFDIKNCQELIAKCMMCHCAK